MLITTSVGLVPDSVRNIVSLILLGNQDQWIPTLTSLLFMTGLALPAGAIAMLKFNKTPNSLFIARDTGITVAGTFNLFRHFRKNVAPNNPESDENLKENMDFGK